MRVCWRCNLSMCGIYPEEANKYGVRGIPTQIFYDASGKEVARHLGFKSKDDILAKFNELGVSLKKKGSK